MRFIVWRRTSSAGRGRAILASLLAFSAIAAFSPRADAATFYKWTDPDGTVHYGDAPPKGFSGTVERVEVDPGEHTIAAPPGAQQPANRELGPPAPAQPDILTQRRETWARLEANLKAARDRLDLARKALAEFTATGADQQVSQTRVDPNAINPNQASEGAELPPPVAGTNPDVTQTQPMRGGMLGMAPRANCRTAAGANGKKVLICPSAVPSQEYFQKEQELEDAVKRAQADVDAAEVAYRKGVD